MLNGRACWSSRLVIRLALAAVLLPSLAGLLRWQPVVAQDHHEAPLITIDPMVNITDV